MKRSWKHILVALSEADGGFVEHDRLPDGNGKTGRPSNGALTGLLNSRFIIWCSAKEGCHNHGYSITPAGLAALEAEQ